MNESLATGLLGPLLPYDINVMNNMVNIHVHFYAGFNYSSMP